MSVSSASQRQIVLAGSNVYTYLSATANNTTAYVELTASTSAAILITHVFRASVINNTGQAGTAILATGAAASEVVIFTSYTAVEAESSQRGADAIWSLPYPIRIPAGTRLSMKTTTNDTNAILSIIYVAESAVV